MLYINLNFIGNKNCEDSQYLQSVSNSNQNSFKMQNLKLKYCKSTEKFKPVQLTKIYNRAAKNINGDKPENTLVDWSAWNQQRNSENKSNIA